jgi:hypothetical protein
MPGIVFVRPPKALDAALAGAAALTNATAKPAIKSFSAFMIVSAFHFERIP